MLKLEFERNIHSSKSFLHSQALSAWEEGLEVINDNLSKSFLLVFSSFIGLLDVGQVGSSLSLLYACPKFFNIDIDLMKF